MWFCLHACTYSCYFRDCHFANVLVHACNWLYRIYVCICYCLLATAVQPFATPSESEVNIEWSTPDVNTGCNGNEISQYIIRYYPAGSTDISEVTVEPTEQNVIHSITNLIPSTMYQYTVTAIDPSGMDIPSDPKSFTTQIDRELLH